jgi:tight adherence protein C
MTLTPGVIAFFLLLALLTATYALFGPKNPDSVKLSPAPRLTEDGKRSLFDQLVRPVVRAFLPNVPRPVSAYARRGGVEALLAKTGNPWAVTPEEYVAVRVLSVLFGASAMLILTVIGYAPLPLLAALPLGAFLGWLAPKSMMDSAWAKRRRDLNEALPEALDLMRIAMNAANNEENSLAKAVTMMEPSITRDELARVLAEVRTGRTLVQALEGFARRCPTDAVESFVRAIAQGKATGVDISTTLSYQAEENRSEYERAVEVKAQKLQTNLFLPLIGFFLPVLMIVIFGPAVSSLMGAL